GMNLIPITGRPARRLGALGAATLGAVLFGGVLAAPGAVADSTNTTVPTRPTITDAQASREAAAVVAEDRRLVTIRASAATGAQTGNAQWKSPFRLGNGDGYTLVLTARSAPY